MQTNLDCQLLILEGLDLMSLVNTAQANRYLSNLASDVFSRKHGFKLIKIQAPTRTRRARIEEIDEIIIRDVELAVRILSVFGRFIKVIKIQFERFTFDEARVLLISINDFCSETLTQLGVSGFTRDLWAVMDNTFPNLEDIAFSKVLEHGKGVNLNRIFPKMRTLVLLDTSIIKSNLLHRNFPHLEHLFVGLLTPQKNFNNETEMVIEKNPQIHHLSLRHYFRSFLETLKHRLQMIETLEILWPQDDYNEGQEIHLGSVKKLLIKTNSITVPKQITFRQVEDIECYCYPQLNNEFVDYLKLNHNLKKLNVTSETGNEQLLQMAGAFPELEEASIICAQSVKAINVLQFIQKANKMNTLMLATNDKFLFKILFERLWDRWIITPRYDGSIMYLIKFNRIN